MNQTQEILKKLAAQQDLTAISIRKVGRLINADEPVHPETVKHHWLKLYLAGEIDYLYTSGTIPKKKIAIDNNALTSDAKLVSIPVYGVADCGPATKAAVQSDLGSVRISSTLLKTNDYSSLYALQASGMSMNKAVVDGHTINDGDYVVVDRNRNTPSDGDCVVAIVDGLANIKRYRHEKDWISLLSDSTEQYDPIFIHPEDQSDNLIGGTVIQVVPKPKY